MIKRITKILNNKLITQQKHLKSRFSSEKEQQQQQKQLQQQIGKQIAEQIQQGGQVVQQVAAQQGQEASAVAAQTSQYVQQDPWMGVRLFDSNWKQMAPYIHSNYYYTNDHKLKQQQVMEKLNTIENKIYAFDLKNLDRARINTQKQFEVKGSSYFFLHDTDRYLETNLAENQKINYNLISHKKIRQLIETKNLNAIKQMYRNEEFSIFKMVPQNVNSIIQIVLNTNYQCQFMLNLIECYHRGYKNQSEELLKPSVKLQKIIDNINNLNEVNKLKFFWKIAQIYQNGISLVNFNLVSHQLGRISYEEIDSIKSYKIIRTVYNSVLGKQSMHKLIGFSLRKFDKNFDEFLTFWGLTNLLLARLSEINELSLANPQSLNHVFKLFELNFAQPKQILTQIIPEVLYETRNKSLFEIYRVHAKSWLEKKGTTPKKGKKQQVEGFIQQFLNQKMFDEEPLIISYNPWTTQIANFSPVKNKIVLRKSQNVLKSYNQKQMILSESRMIQHLIIGDYNFVLNNFLATYNPAFDRTQYNIMRKIIAEANQNEYTDENTKALYILKELKEKFLYLAQPVDFSFEYFQQFKKFKMFAKTAQQGKFNKKFQGGMGMRRKTRQQNQRDQDRGYSRKKVNRTLDGQGETFDIDNKQPMRNKPKQIPQKLFKKNKHIFSTTKQTFSTLKPTSDSYQQYRQIVKQLSSQTGLQEFGFNLDKNIDLKHFKQEVEKRSKDMNEKNHKSLLNMNHVPIVGNGANLLKYLFLKKPQNQIPRLDERLKKKLKFAFISEIGALQKDFSQYLTDCRFNFPLAPQVYINLLEDQKANYNRKSFKTIIAHLIAYRQQLTTPEIKLICEISRKHRIGITLLEIYNLMIENKVKAEKQAIYTICDTLQKFKKINNDLFLLTKKYCQNLGIEFETKMMGSYVRSLLLQEQDDNLAQFCQILKTQLKPKPYKLKSNLSAQENIKQEKLYKQFQKKQYNKVLYEIIELVVDNLNSKLPAFVATLFDQYEGTQAKLKPNELSLSLIVYCTNVEKFLITLRTLKASPEQITIFTFECAIKALKLNSKQLQSHSEEVFNITLFTHNFLLNEEQINKCIQIFKFLNSPNVFIKFLEYILRFNLPVNYEIKSNFYYIMNGVNDDFSKNNISGLLDFIFNSNREKQREQFRKVQIAQEQKVKLLQDLQKKEIFTDKTQKQQEQIIKDIEAGKLEDAKKPKKNKSVDKLQKTDKSKQTKSTKQTSSKQQQPVAQTPTQTAKPVVKQQKKALQTKAQRRRPISRSAEQVLSSKQTDGFLRKSTLKPKLRSKSLTVFQQMFTKSQDPTGQGEDLTKGKGGKGGPVAKGGKGGKYGNVPEQKKDTKGAPNRKK